MPNLQIYDRLKSFDDYQRLEDEFQLKKQLAQSEIAKSQQVDVSKLGEQAFLKAAQGMEITPQEAAALQYLDAKAQTAGFNPVTGAMQQKPGLLDRAGLSFEQPASANVAPTRAPARQPSPSPSGGPDISGVLPSEGTPTPQPEPSEWDIAFQNEMAAAAGNPRLQQTIRENYAKSKISMTEAEAKNAGFADRISASAPLIDAAAPATSDPIENALSSVPLAGNYLTSKEYQSGTQAQRDFVNALLRRESGANIADSEFENAAKQYFPRPGDSQQVLAQKAANRKTALKGIQKSAGPAYKPSIPSNPKAVKPGDTKTSSTGTYLFNGGDPADKNNWKKIK